MLVSMEDQQPLYCEGRGWVPTPPILIRSTKVSHLQGYIKYMAHRGHYAHWNTGA